jgi:membrane associated rhomboid family serine protease
VDVCESIVRGDPFRRSRKYAGNRSPGNSFSIRRNQSTLTSNSSFPIRPAIIMQALPEVSTDAETSFSEPSRDPDRPFVGTPIQTDEGQLPDFGNRSRFGIRPGGRQQAFNFPARRQQLPAPRSRSSPLVHQQKVEESEDELPTTKRREESRVKFADVKTREMDYERSDTEQSSSKTTATTSALRPRDLPLMPLLSKSQPQLRRGVQFTEPSATTLNSRRAGMDSEETILLQALHNQQTVDEDDELFFDSLHSRPRFTVGSDGEGTTSEASIAARMLPPPAATTLSPPVTTPVRFRELLKQKELNIEVPPTRTFFQRLRRSFRNSFPSQSVKSLSTIIKTSNEERNRRRRELPFGGSFKRRPGGIDPILKRQLDNEFYDDRPYFSYYITVVQIIIMISALFRYGFGTSFTSNYLGVTERSGDVITATLSNAHIVIWEQNNIFIGPRYADLVQMGAKYTPCMRRDVKIMAQIEEDRRIEAIETGCCVSSEGCFQTSECSKQFSRFIKWTTDSKGITNRAVCGQDPRYCRNPESVAPNRWSKDISKWPICKEVSTRIPSSDTHMKCEIRGRPCCIQLHGQCRITTKEYCDFVKGYYHENATLCSQVSCLGDICGMTPFLRRDSPDQFYRFFTPLFIHAGILPMLVTIWVQFSYMRRFEILIGWARTAIIYFVSGIGGYLASAVFVPYMPQVGPIPAQSGILGAMVVNVIYNWSEIKKPHYALFCHLAVALFLFVCGFLPFIDNFAQVFGFFFGALLACALIPYIGADEDLKPNVRRQNYYVHIRILVVAISLVGTIGLFVLLFLLFAVVDPNNLPDISIISCLPFLNARLCDQQSLTLKDWLPI